MTPPLAGSDLDDDESESVYDEDNVWPDIPSGRTIRRPPLHVLLQVEAILGLTHYRVTPNSC